MGKEKMSQISLYLSSANLCPEKIENNKLSSEHPQMLHPRALTKQRDWLIMWVKCKDYQKFKMNDVLFQRKSSFEHHSHELVHFWFNESSYIWNVD